LTMPAIDLVLCARDITELESFDVPKIQLNINLEQDRNNINGADYDLLIHLAWGYLDNYKSLMHLESEYLHQFAFLKKLINDGLSNITILGTCFEYGLQSGALIESMPANPMSSYGIAKDTLRRSLELVCSDNGVNFKWLRLFYIWGKDQPERTLFGQLNRAIERGDTVFPLSGGEQLRDYLEINEAVERIISLALQNNTQGVINCCSGIPISIRNLVEQYLMQLGSPEVKLEWGAFPYSEYEAMAFWGDAKKMNDILNNSY